MILPHITVCVLTYKRADLLTKTLRSITAQKYQNFSILVLDDTSPDNTTEVVEKFADKKNLIRYVRNKVNLGLTQNFAKALRLCRKSDIVIFIGDDDILLSPNTLNEYQQVFMDKKIGIVRARQVLFTANGLKQVSQLENSGNTQIFEHGKQSYGTFVFESISIAGLAFRVTPQLANLTAPFETMYPQFYLTARYALEKNCAQINKYLVGVRSHEGQLNVMQYTLKGICMNIFGDFANIHEHLQNEAHKNKLYAPSRSEITNPVASFIPILFPANTVNKGHRSTLSLIFLAVKTQPKNLIYPKFLFYSACALFPKKTITSLIEYRNTKNLYAQRVPKYVSQSVSRYS